MYCIYRCWKDAGCFQGLVAARSWRFESSLGHHSFCPSRTEIPNNAPMRLQILRLRMLGLSLSAIARSTGRARQTVTKVVRAPEIQAKMRELRERLLGDADNWPESVNFAIRHEANGALAYRLLADFGVIPTSAQDEPAGQLSSSHRRRLRI
jgi:hypothetical protein